MKIICQPSRRILKNWSPTTALVLFLTRPRRYRRLTITLWVAIKRTSLFFYDHEQEYGVSSGCRYLSIDCFPISEQLGIWVVVFAEIRMGNLSASNLQQFFCLKCKSDCIPFHVGWNFMIAKIPVLCLDHLRIKCCSCWTTKIAWK